MRVFVTGTDTDIGKTVFAAALAGALQATYWKPIQAGTLDASDSERVRALARLSEDQILPEAYRLHNACSPHRAAELDGVAIDWPSLSPPDADPLIVEGAGGLLVPVTRDILVIDLIERWRFPAVLVARTSLGTINHSLLSIAALQSRGIPIAGVAFVGDPYPDSEDVICAMSGVKRLGRLPFLDPLDADTLRRAFADNFDLRDFQ